MCSNVVGGNIDGVIACRRHSLIQTGSGETLAPIETSEPVTPIEQDTSDDITPARRGRGGPGRKAAEVYVPGSGQVPDLTKKRYNKGSRAVLKAFDHEAYAKVARRKANAVDRFFVSAQKEKKSQDGVEDVEDVDDHSAGDFFDPAPKESKYRYRGCDKFTKFGEFLVCMMYIRHECNFGKLALWWLGNCRTASTKTIRNIVFTWIAYLDSILQMEPLWISAERADKIRPSGFKSKVADDVQHIGDCTNINTGGCQVSNPLAASLLRSDYYGGTCGA